MIFIKKILDLIFQSITDHNGKISSKRIGGALCLTQGLLMKSSLFFYSFFRLTKTDFEKLDYCCDSLIYTGAALLGGSIVEIFAARKK